MITLYRKNPLGIGTWRIWNEDSIIHIAHATQIGGQEVHHTEHVETNASGRSIVEQVQLRINSRVSRQFDKGYKATLEEAQEGATNQLGLLAPMLAQPLDKVRVDTINWRNAFVQRKYDGHRCLITKQGGELIAYSRKGKVIDSIGHILEYLQPRIPEGYTIDGELYIHGKSLQNLSSLIRRKQVGSVELCYHAYDLASPEPFEERLRELYSIIDNVYHDEYTQCSVAETLLVDGMQEAMDLFGQFRSEGYEGAILRQSNAGYEDNKRSKQLIKIKEREDAEFEILGIEEGQNRIAILHCLMPSGKTFAVTAPGTMSEKSAVLDSPDTYIGKHITVEYSNLTADGIPFHPVAIRYREDI